MALLVIVHRTKPIFKPGREFDISNYSYMKFGRNLRMSTSAYRQVAGILVARLGYWTKPMFKLGQSFDKSDPYMKFGSNRVIND